MTKRDAIIGLVAGALLGAVVLGAGGRAGMRVIALANHQQAIFTPEGSIAVVALGSATGALIGVIFLMTRLISQRWLRAGVFWAVCLALVLRGLHPVGLLNAAVFLPLLALHGSLLNIYWCRRLRRSEPVYGWTRSSNDATLPSGASATRT